MTVERIRPPAPTRRLALALTALAVLPFAAGCGGEERGGGTGTGTTGTAAKEQTQPRGKPVATVTISETDFKLRPANPTIPKPGVVEFTAKNDGQSPHALEVEGPTGEAETEVIQSGETTKLKVDLSRPGTYVMYCPVGNHRELGMVGKVKVAGGRSGGGGGSGGAPSGGGQGY